MKKFIFALIFSLLATYAHAALVWTCTVNFKNPLAQGYLVAGTCTSDTGGAATANGDTLTAASVCGFNTSVITAIFSSGSLAAGSPGFALNYDVANAKLQQLVQGTAGATNQFTSYTGTLVSIMTTRYMAICR